MGQESSTLYCYKNNKKNEKIYDSNDGKSERNKNQYEF